MTSETATPHLDRAAEQDHLFTLDPARVYPVLERADGVHVWDTDGNQYLDAVSGLGVVNIGYGRKEVAEAIAAQAAKMPFNAGNIFSNEPAIRLAADIAEITPGDLDFVHFTSGGSEAVEVALKMARQYHVERGEPSRDKVIGRWTSYHGATLGGLSVGGAVLRRAKYLPMLLDMPHIPPIYCYRCPWGLTYPECGVTCADELEREILRVGPDRVAAFIAEPIVASVGGAIQPQPEYFPKIREICDRYGVLLIIDEVITGFGRTGRNFGIEHYGVIPDLMVMGKGISSGYAPLAAVAVRNHVRQTFVDANVAFEHIFTYGGSPVATAAGIAVVEILRRERLAERAEELGPAMAANLEGLREFPFVGDVRSIGFMAGIEFVADRATRAPFEPATKVAVRVREAGLRNGIVVYPGTGMADGKSGDIISLYPPLTFTLDDIADMGERLRATFAEVQRDLPDRLTPPDMVARLHPGAAILSMDHSVITLHEGGRPDGGQTGFLSMYDIAFHREHGGGHVALLEVAAAGVDAVFTDRLDLGRAWQARLRDMGYPATMLQRDPIVVADFWRDPWVGDSFGYRFRAPGIDFAARWWDLEAPFFAEGNDRDFSATEDIWSLFVAAASASLVINGVAASGAPYDDDAWAPKLGRNVSSAHSALGETRITPAT